MICAGCGGEFSAFGRRPSAHRYCPACGTPSATQTRAARRARRRGKLWALAPDKFAEFYAWYDGSDEREWKDGAPFGWWDQDSEDEAAILAELSRAGIVQGHRREQPLEQETRLLAAIARDQIRREAPARWAAVADADLQLAAGAAADFWGE